MPCFLFSVSDPTPVLHGIDRVKRHSNVAVSDNGTVIYVQADQLREAELLWLDRDGNPTPVPGGRVPFEDVALSPDGREVAGHLIEGMKAQVWVRDLERGAQRLLVSDGDSFQPIWSRDGRFITYWSTPGNTRRFSEACGWNWRRGVADAWPKGSETRGLVSGWPIASVQRVHESRRYGRLDLLGWQGDATPLQSVQRSRGKS